MEIADFTELTVGIDSGVAVVELNRPDRRNAWNGRMAVEYRWALHHAHVRPDVRVVVVTGAGGDFCVGADSRLLSSIADSDGAYQPEQLALPPFPAGTPATMQRNHAFPLTISTPVIAAVGGVCAGAGFLLATYADVRFVSDDVRINTAFARMGLPAEYGVGWLLTRMVGIPNSAQLLYRADIVNGPEALRLGWAQRCVPHEELTTAAVGFAQTLARHSSPQSLKTMKRQLFIDSAGDFDAAYTRSVEDMNAALGSADFAEGVASLRQRRQPDFLTALPHN